MGELPEWLSRVLAERDELLVKINKLSSFISSNEEIAADELSFSLLKEQLIAMQTYESILTKRINLFFKGKTE